MNAPLDTRPRAAHPNPGDPASLPPEVVRKRRLQLLLLAAVFFGPLAVAFYMYYGGAWQPQGRTNAGELLQPVRQLPEVSLQTPSGTPTKPDFLRGKWSLVYVDEGACDAQCRQTLEDVRVTRLALDRDVDRVQRVFLYESSCCDRALLEGPQQGLVVAWLDEREGAKLRAAFPTDTGPLAQSDRVWLVDPRGNLVMRYATPLDKRGVVKDMEKLLKLSHIG